MSLFHLSESSFCLKASHYLWLALFVFVLFLPGRASIPPLDRDEARYMQATSQMLDSGDYVDVRFQDQPRYLQPAGIYWLEALAVKVVHPNSQKEVWPYRIPSLLAAVGSVLLTVWIGSLLFDSYIGLLAGLFLAVSILLTAEGRMATIDTTLLFFILLAQSSVAKAWLYRLSIERLSFHVAVIYWGAIGCGLMLKGPVILIPTLLTPLTLAWVQKDKLWWKHLRPSYGWLISLLIALPWCLAIAIVSHGQFFTNAVGTNFLGKVTSGQQAHGLPPGYYLLVFLITFWPGSLFTVWSLPFIWMERKTESVKFLLCWIIPYWVVFEIIATKLPHYILPIYPAVAILTSASLWKISEQWYGPVSRWNKGFFYLYMTLWCLVGIILAVGSIFWTHYMTGEWFYAAMIGALTVLGLIGYVVYCIFRQNIQKASLVSILASLIIYIELFVILIPALQPEWLSYKIARTINFIKPCPATVLASSSYSEPSLVFLVGKETQLINVKKTADFLEKNKTCGLALVDRKDQKQFKTYLDKKEISVDLLGKIKGLNYSTGKKLNLGLFKVNLNN